MALESKARPNILKICLTALNELLHFFDGACSAFAKMVAYSV